MSTRSMPRSSPTMPPASPTALAPIRRSRWRSTASPRGVTSSRYAPTSSNGYQSASWTRCTLPAVLPRSAARIRSACRSPIRRFSGRRSGAPAAIRSAPLWSAIPRLISAPPAPPAPPSSLSISAMRTCRWRRSGRTGSLAPLRRCRERSRISQAQRIWWTIRPLSGTKADYMPAMESQTPAAAQMEPEAWSGRADAALPERPCLPTRTRKRLPMDSVEVERVQGRDLDGAAMRPALVDPFGRAITYLRVSVTDRCDFRCVYCMAEDMHFLPKADLLTLEELDRLCSAFIARGVRKLRLTGGEPLVRRGIMTLFASLSRHLESGHLDELTLTTNGSQLAKYARELKEHGVHRVNVSLDTLDAEKFRAITRWGSLPDVLAGIDAAQAAGLKIKINAVALKGVNEDEFPGLIEWAHGRGLDF